MFLVLKNGDFEKASEVMQKLDKQHQTIIGVPKISALALYVDHCIEAKMPSRAIVSLNSVILFQTYYFFYFSALHPVLR